MRREKTRLKRLAMTLVLASGVLLGAERPLALAQGSHAGISSREAGPSDVSGLPLPAPPAAEPGSAIASSLLAAWDEDQNLSLTDGEFGQAARRFFELADTKRDKRLTLDEVLSELARLLESPSVPPGTEGSRSKRSDGPGFKAYAYLTDRLVAQADSNGDNEITSREWRRASRSSFSQWDADGNGRLEQDELQRAFAACLP